MLLLIQCNEDSTERIQQWERTKEVEDAGREAPRVDLKWGWQDKAVKRRRGKSWGAGPRGPFQNRPKPHSRTDLSRGCLLSTYNLQVYFSSSTGTISQTIPCVRSAS